MIKETHYNLRAIIILLNKGKNSKIYQREEKKYISENTLIRWESYIMFHQEKLEETPLSHMTSPPIPPTVT